MVIANDVIITDKTMAATSKRIQFYLHVQDIRGNVVLVEEQLRAALNARLEFFV